MGMEAEALVAASGFNYHTKAQLDHWGVDATAALASAAAAGQAAWARKEAA